MSALLNAIGSNVQSLANGALSSLIGGKISSGISKDMMDYQDKLNDQNALVAYNRQRQLMGDAALLQKQGMLKAGYNIAFGSNGSVMNAGTPSSSNVGLGSAESKMPNSFQSLLDAKNVESNAKVADSNSKLLDSKKVGQDIDNDYKVANAVADLSNKAADTRDKNAKARSNELANVLLSKYGDRLKAAETGKAESDKAAAADNAALASINREIAQSTRHDKEALAHELVENEKKRGRLLNAQVVTENGKVLVQRSEIAKNYADADNKREETAGFKLNNEYLSKTLVDRVNKQGYDAVLAKIATLPHSYRDVVMRSRQWQVMVYKLEHNQQLSEQELKNLDELLRLDTYDPNKNAANWINFVTHMK